MLTSVSFSESGSPIDWRTELISGHEITVQPLISLHYFNITVHPWTICGPNLWKRKFNFLKKLRQAKQLCAKSARKAEFLEKSAKKSIRSFCTCINTQSFSKLLDWLFPLWIRIHIRFASWIKIRNQYCASGSSMLKLSFYQLKRRKNLQLKNQINK